MRNLVSALGNVLRDSVAALTLRAAQLKQDASDMQDEKDRAAEADSIPYVLIYDNMHQQETFLSLRELATTIGMDVNEAIDIVRYRNGIYGAFILHQVSDDDSSFAFR